jgi:hypothetical protein
LEIYAHFLQTTAVAKVRARAFLVCHRGICTCVRAARRPDVFIQRERSVNVCYFLSHSRPLPCCTCTYHLHL